MMTEEALRHQEAVFHTINEQMMKVMLVRSRLAEARKKVGDDEGKRKSLLEALVKLRELRRDLNEEREDAQHDLRRIGAAYKWAKPLERGSGYAHQPPYVPWDGFKMMMSHVPIAEREEIRNERLTMEELNGCCLVDVKGNEVDFPTLSFPTTFGKLISWMDTHNAFPKKGSVLHRRFTEEVFPKIVAAMRKREERIKSLMENDYARRLKEVVAVVEANGG